MKHPVIALAAISPVPTSTIMKSVPAGAPVVVWSRVAAGGTGVCGRPASLPGRSPRRALRRTSGHLARWITSRCPSAAVAAL
ncbi:hypothetical protein SOCE26_016730 [Sorangium cellulosum]|uniref:Uncharacterized protein n=1 Tax=Sorangium cellulosum TaxID=56 RepID=A0A2L0ELU5_SORCE|nr:hypothetical protein [Sorangium cellulosum]AUX40273.1 hypothetical protein SOCE26_016730 [Sorangium cellulosum]